jgi:glycerophosphoryl diester phosphodiesterase
VESKDEMELEKLKRPLIIAHRGYRAEYPENTLAAFRGALDVGVQMIELDVILTKDRHVVVAHDQTLERTAGGKGMVRDTTLEELKKLDAGSWFHPRFAGEKIPTLEEVLNLVGNRAWLNIEIKWHAYEAHGPPDAIEKQVVELLRQHSTPVLISSFKPEILQNIASMEDRPPLALLYKSPGYGDHLELCKKTGAFSWHPGCAGLEKEYVDVTQKEGFLVIPYNVDSLEDFKRVIQWGVDGVITSDPPLIMEAGIK